MIGMKRTKGETTLQNEQRYNLQGKRDRKERSFYTKEKNQKSKVEHIAWQTVSTLGTGNERVTCEKVWLDHRARGGKPIFWSV